MDTSPALLPTAVVVVDNAASADLTRLLQQVLKTAPRSVEVLVASLRAPRLSPSQARRVRLLRGRTVEAMDAAVLAEAMTPRLVLVASAAGRVSSGWLEEITRRALIYRDVTSAVDASTGGFLLYPPGVTTPSATTVPWLQAQHLSARGRTPVESSTTSVSAVLIVKNEEDVLDACLNAVEPFVDEIVVYDTGSTDATLDIARNHGAVVVEGYWNDHFGDARNRALEHATGQWVLQVDADEVMEGDPAEFRARLASEASDQLHLKIVSSAWRGVRSGLETLPVRVFRRGTACWKGALHEYPYPLDEQNAKLSPVPAPARLIHSGYELGKVQDRDKPTRNIELSLRDLDETPVGTFERGERLSNFIRSLLWAGEIARAMPYFDELLSSDGNPTAVCMTGRVAIGIMLGAGKVDAAWAWIDKLAAYGESAGNLAVARARMHLHLGEIELAREVVMPFVNGADGGRDPWKAPFDGANLDLVLADALLAEGDIAGALEGYLSLLPVSSELLNLSTVLTTCVQAGRPLRDVAALAPEEFLARSVREGSAFHPSGALGWFEACVEAHPSDVRFVVAGNLFAARCDWQRALTWAVRAREWALDGVCALRGLGENTSMPPMDRVMAWLVLAEALGEADAPTHLSALVTELVDIDLDVLRGVAELNGLPTGLLARDVTLPQADEVHTA